MPDITDQNNKVNGRRFIVEGKVRIVDLIVIVGILFSGFAWYFKTEAATSFNSERIAALDEAKLEKKIYNLYVEQQKEKDIRLEKAIENLINAVNDLNVQIARLKR